jgi:hypothetical protein
VLGVALNRFVITLATEFELELKLSIPKGTPNPRLAQ